MHRRHVPDSGVQSSTFDTQNKPISRSPKTITSDKKNTCMTLTTLIRIRCRCRGCLVDGLWPVDVNEKTQRNGVS